MVELRSVKALVASTRPRAAPNGRITRVVTGSNNPRGASTLHPRPLYRPLRQQKFLAPRLVMPMVRESYFLVSNG